MSIIETLVDKFPVRKSKKQKESFRTWVHEEASAMGYSVKTEWNSGNYNVVIGNPEMMGVRKTVKPKI